MIRITVVAERVAGRRCNGIFTDPCSVVECDGGIIGAYDIDIDRTRRIGKTIRGGIAEMLGERFTPAQ